MTPDAVDIRRAERKALRDELSAFLKSRRGRISPDEVGLPPGPRRRTPGLRREEVAQLSGIGITWYTWLEQGRSINVSTQVLDAVARTLRLDAAEHAHLYRLADVPTVPASGCEQIPEELQTILDHLGALPACLLGPRYDVLRYNDAYQALCPGCISSGRNTLWEVFTTPGCCNAFAPQQDDKGRMVAYLRGAYGKNVGDPTWLDFIGRLSTASPEFAALWERNDVAVPIMRKVRILRSLAVGDIEMYITSLTVPTLTNSWIQIFTPAADADRRKLEELLAMSHDEQLAPLLAHQAKYHAASA
ncbi:helix-turn-helix transcriptional regulator [Antrihabitans cavernicola]|uniref:Helix-turn-helix domain-containing protein n=1 Tax=Antrihabitans cavernicola TaxID=2495913 RepID=A0A5A7SI71_9NOCA|nr:helix-turn-helix transcriptional regulator [Spelaeibacter cavernicola]KAA0024427.1 helix-turn-helix domain-containing protein [Spelaeibacter cavernicola]